MPGTAPAAHGEQNEGKRGRKRLGVDKVNFAAGIHAVPALAEARIWYLGNGGSVGCFWEATRSGCPLSVFSALLPKLGMC